MSQNPANVGYYAPPPTKPPQAPAPQAGWSFGKNFFNPSAALPAPTAMPPPNASGGAFGINGTTGASAPTAAPSFSGKPPGPAAPTTPDPRFDMTRPGDSENFYSQHKDDLMSPSASEQLYAQGAAGSNPYYDYAEQQATNSVNAAERARGGYNSGAALAEIGNSSAYLRGQQAHELGQLAGQADSAKLGRYGLTGQMADTSQNHRENRIQTGFEDEFKLDNAQADKVHGFYDTAGNENQQALMAAIEAWGKAQGMSAAEIKQFIDLGTSVGGTLVKAAA